MTSTRLAFAPLALFIAACPANVGSLDSTIDGDAAVIVPADGPHDDEAGDASGDVADGGPAACPVGPTTEPGVVATDRGLVRGQRDGETIVFRGLRFAAPPIGQDRWRPPRSADCIVGVQDAREFLPECPQMPGNGPMMGQVVGNEDCLGLNVWAPAVAPTSPVPVMVFIHGGGNNQGSASIRAGTTLVYDGRSLARRGAVVVTFNYRLGALGFLAHAGLDRENTSGTSGNWAQMDMIAALQWVQRNARAFGGDPGRVMIFGESAGGVNVQTLLASPLARGLFHRALSESGGAAAATRAAALDASNRLATAAGCNLAPDPIACLRMQTPEQLLRALPQIVGITSNDFGPYVDGYVLPSTPQQAYAMGMQARVPVIVGTNRDEAASFVPRASVTTEAQFLAAARPYLAQYGLSMSAIDGILAMYPVASFPSPWHAMVALVTETRWTCPARATARAISASGAPIWRYYFTQALDPTRAPMASMLGAYHGLELFYVFGVVDGAGGYRATASDLALSDVIQRYWVRFASTGDPSGDAPVAWQRYQVPPEGYVELGTPTQPGMGLLNARCDALAAAAGM